MTQNKLRESIGYLIVITHFVLICFIIYLWLSIKMNEEEAKTAIKILIPVFAAFSTPIIRYFVKHRIAKKDTSEKVTGIFIFLSLFLPAILTLFIFGLIINQCFFNKIGLESFSWALGLSESLFGIYIGFIINDLFEAVASQDTQMTPAPLAPAEQEKKTG